ncbi:MAG: hypothetical protein LBE81_13860, partial [Azonexus sp.]|nr:hypothetical protein [Azonexus sp.]
MADGVWRNGISKSPAEFVSSIEQTNEIDTARAFLCMVLGGLNARFDEVSVGVFSACGRSGRDAVGIIIG